MTSFPQAWRGFLHACLDGAALGQHSHGRASSLPRALRTLYRHRRRPRYSAGSLRSPRRSRRAVSSSPPLRCCRRLAHQPGRQASSAVLDYRPARTRQVSPARGGSSPTWRSFACVATGSSLMVLPGRTAHGVARLRDRSHLRSGVEIRARSSHLVRTRLPVRAPPPLRTN